MVLKFPETPSKYRLIRGKIQTGVNYKDFPHLLFRAVERKIPDKSMIYLVLVNFYVRVFLDETNWKRGRNFLFFPYYKKKTIN